MLGEVCLGFLWGLGVRAWCYRAVIDASGSWLGVGGPSGLSS